MKKLLFVLFAVVMLAACGKKAPELGTWKMKSVSGENLTESELNTTFTLNEDGSFSMTRDGESKNGKWKWSDDKTDIILTRDGDREEMMEEVKIDGSKMTFQADGAEITLEKQ